jgi:hypothetical protein
MPVDCKQLAVLSKWGEISIAIREQTNFEQDKLIVCRAEICGSIFGIQGNPDISGIGVRPL